MVHLATGLPKGAGDGRNAVPGVWVRTPGGGYVESPDVKERVAAFKRLSLRTVAYQPTAAP